MTAAVRTRATGAAGLAVARTWPPRPRRRSVPSDQVVLASHGVIGAPLDINKVRAGITQARSELSTRGSEARERAIMTTDRFQNPERSR